MSLRRISTAVRICMGLLIISSTVTHAGTERWSASTRAEFERGTLEGVMLDADSRLVLAPQSETLWGPEEGIVWDVAVADGQPSGVFVALSGPGRLLHVSAKGESTLWYDGGPETLVTAVLADGKGGVYAGLSPDGSVLHLSAPQKIEREFGTDSKFIWDLEADPRGGFWAATGVPGSILHTTGGEDWSLWYESEDDPVRALLAHNGSLYAGTGGRGRLLRLDDDETSFVLFAADEPEIVALAARSDGRIYALAAAGAKQVKSDSGGEDKDKTANNSATVTATAPPAAGSTAAKPKPKSPAQTLSSKAGGVLYRIGLDGGIEPVWESSVAMPFGLGLSPAQQLYIATGDLGHLVEINEEDRASRVRRIPSTLASAITVDAAGTWWVGGTSDARLERVGSVPSRNGAYVSEPIDAGTVAKWGRIDWRGAAEGGAKVSVSLRAGNSEDPDESWSSWIAAAKGTQGSSVPGQLPPSRWMQIRLEFEATQRSAPAVEYLEISYAPANRSPRIEDFQIQDRGMIWIRTEPQASSTGGPFIAEDPYSREVAERLSSGRSRGTVRRYFEPGMRTLSWSIDDPDLDRVRYRVELQRVGSEVWVLLADEHDDEFLSWDERDLADGAYRARLRADDGMDHPNGGALADEQVSELFWIDHSRPIVENRRVEQTAGRAVVWFEAHDAGGAVANVEWTQDGTRWWSATPLDGVADSPIERYRIELEPLPGMTTVRVRVVDRNGNVGGAVFQVGQ